jgi:hypothetical protein
MKRVTSLAVALASVALPASAGAAQRVFIGCQDSQVAGGYEWLKPVVAPGNCTMPLHNWMTQQAPAGDLGHISGTHWSHWGRSTATGKGWLELTTGRARATMKASGIKIIPGIPSLSYCRSPWRYYSRVSVTAAHQTWLFHPKPTRQC